MKIRQIIGFSIIELMVAVLIMAILASVALPSYHSYVSRARMKEAGQVLLKDAQFLERWYNQCGSYATSTTASASPACAEPNVAVANLRWPTLPYMVSPEVGESMYVITYLSTKPATSTDINNYRLRAIPLCGFAAASNDCACVNWSARANPTNSGGSSNCNVCADNDGNLVYDANWNCSN